MNDDLFAWGENHPARFNGPEYVPERDEARLTSQMQDIVDLMRDQEWRTLGEIETLTGHPQASISAQLRHLRKPRFGSNTVDRRHEGGGLYVYRLTLNLKTTLCQTE